VQARASHALTLISLDPDTVQPMLADNPYYRLLEIPPDVYRSRNAATALAVNNLLIVRADESADTVYAIVDAVYSHLDELREANAVARQIDPAQSLNLPIPLHEGALRYFRQQ
jgi:TRAP transporter TAXI family solute receptor